MTDYSWLEPIERRTREIREETQRIKDETEKMRQTKITEENLKDFNIPGLTFKPGGSITVSGDAQMTLKVDSKEIEIKNE